MRKIPLLLGLVLLCAQLMAQTRTITGKVTSSQGEPIPNASVTVKGTSIGTTTKADGMYSLQVPDNATTLVISSVGFSSTDVAIGKQTALIQLQPEGRGLDEVVVVAYGTAKKSALTNSVAQINSKELENRPVTNVLSALAGLAPGVTTGSTNGQPGSSPAVRIRGIGSISSSNAPLFVVDGVPYDYDISNINVDDIENVSVLKDAAASALYGSRAANGVIQITTKRGKKDRPMVQASAIQGFVSRALPEYDRVNAQQYYPLMWEAYRNSLVFPTSGAGLAIDSANKIATGLFPRNGAGLQVYAGKTYSDISQLLAYNPFNVARTDIVRTDGTLNPSAQLLYADDLDWLKDIQREGTRGDYNLSVSGGSAKSDYYISLGYTDEKAFVRNSDYKRYSARVSINTQALSWFKTGLNLSGIVTEANQGASDGSSTGLVNPFYTSRIMGPIYPVYAHNTTTGDYILDANGNKIYDIGSLAALGLPNRPVAGGRHAIYETILNENILHRNVINARTYGEISFLKYFKFTTNIAADVSNSLRSQFENKIVGDGAPNGRSRRNTTDNITITTNELLNYSQSFGKHSVEVLAGHEDFSATYKASTNLRTGQIIEGITELANFTTTSSLTSAKDVYRIESYLSRLNYNFDEKYFVSGSFRRDGSSRFHPDRRWGNYWSVGAGWRIDREDLLQPVAWINLLKLRSSYGSVGNDNLLDDNGASVYYAYQAFYNLGNNNNTEPGAAQATLAGNPNLGWEVNKQFDIGLEFTIFKNRLNGIVEFFDRRSSNLIFKVPAPVSSGTISVPTNIGTMYNKGIEVTLTGDVIRNRDFSWVITTNFTTFKNKITKLPAEKVPSTASATQQWEVGHSIYEFYVRDWYGVDPDNGAGLFTANTWVPATTYVNKNGDSVTTDQNNARFHYAGTAIPDFFGSVISSFTYKGVGVSFQLNYQVGGLIYDATYSQLMHSGSYGTASQKDILKRWTTPGQVTDVPRLDAGRTAVYGAASDRWLTDATYLNIQNVTVSYALPKNIAGKIHMQGARFYVMGENLYMFTKRKGMNPLQSFTGVTSNVYIPSRTITAGLTVTL